MKPDAWKKFDPGWITDRRGETRPREGDAAEGREEGWRQTWLNGEKGRLPNLITKEAFGDCEVHVEFLIAKNSNAGIKFHEVYEIQILDSHGKKDIDGDRHGRRLPAGGHQKGGYLDSGIAPKVNAAKPAGRVEHARRGLEVAAIRREGREDRQRDDREGDAQRRGDPRERREVKTPTGGNWMRKEPRPARSCSSPTTARPPGGT